MSVWECNLTKAAHHNELFLKAVHIVGNELSKPSSNPR